MHNNYTRIFKHSKRFYFIAVLVLISFICFLALFWALWNKNSDIAQVAGTIFAALITIVSPVVYDEIQKKSDERNARRKNNLLINRVHWELKENEIRLKNTLTDLKSHYIASISCVVWESSNIEIELEKGLYTNLFKLYAALKLVKGSYDKVESAELKEVIEIIVERMDDAIEKLSFF